MADQSDNWRANLEFAAQSDVGMRRSNNQDSYAVVLASDESSWQRRGHLFIVADGMGAHAAGELASKLAADNIPHTYHKSADLPAPQALEKAVIDANQLIHGRGKADTAFQGMGTTCCSLALLPAGALVAHVGDSRIYRLRQNVLEQLTFDHSLVWEMAASGKVRSEDVAGFVPKNVITRSLGPNAQVKVDLEGPLPLETGDTFLLCSDGLTGPVQDEEIAVVLATLPVEDAVQTLIHLANLRGGPDNITVVAVRVKGPLTADSPTATPRPTLAGQVHPGIWTAMVMLLMVALILFVVGEPLGAGLSVVASLLVGGIAWLQKHRGGDQGQWGAIGGPYGKGPYRRYPAQPTLQMANSFAELVRRLKETARREAIPLDWSRFNRLQESAQAAIASEDYASAVVDFCQAIRYMTGELYKVRHP